MNDLKKIDEVVLENEIINSFETVQQWQGSTEEMWTKIDSKLIEERKWWKRKIKIHFIMLGIFISLLIFFICITQS